MRNLRSWSAAPTRNVETAPTPTVNVLRGLVARVTPPLLSDGYLTLLNPLWVCAGTAWPRRRPGTAVALTFMARQIASISTALRSLHGKSRLSMQYPRALWVWGSGRPSGMAKRRRGGRS